MKKIIIVAAVAVVALSGCTIQFETTDRPTAGAESEFVPSLEPEPVEPDPEPTAEPEQESRGITADDDILATRDEAATVLQGWDSSFNKPLIVFYDDYLVVDGETFDEDTAAWYDGKIYIDPDTIYYYYTEGNLEYTVGHEMGHGWEEHYDRYYPVGRSSELYADCMAGAIGAAAGWDTDAMIDYARYNLGEDDIHGDGEDRYDAMTTGVTGGHEACSH